MTAATPTEVVACPTCGRRNRMPAAARGAPRCGHCGSALPWVVSADDATFAKVVDAATLAVLVDMWAPWCGPCRTVSPALDALAGELAGRVKLVKVDVDTSPRTAARFAVQGIPTLLVLHRGQVVSQRVGAAGPAELRAWLEDALAGVGDGTGGAVDRTPPTPGGR